MLQRLRPCQTDSSARWSHKIATLTLICFATGTSIPAEDGTSNSDHDQVPNIVVILADDLGYGDVGCYNRASKIPTPHLDRLAADGIRFTDAHSPATVCTPTRYSLLTGQMSFRTGYGGVFTGAGGPCLIDAERPTIATILKQAGYRTAMFGKWHVGLTFHDKQGQPIHKGGLEAVRRIDYSRPISDGPTRHGFDLFYGTACCPTTDWLYAYIDQDRIPVPPTELLDQSTLPKHDYSHDNRRGLVAPNFDLEEVDMVFLDKSQAFLREHMKQHADQPFFLFHSMQAVHLPSFPSKQFHGKSKAGPHGDFILQMDWIVGQLLKTLDELKIAENTIVIFASDNGPEVPTVLAMRAKHGHDGARPWRGVKRDQWEGGHRTPFIVRWPGQVKAGSVNDQLLSLTDLFATCAAIVDAPPMILGGEDSVNMLPALRGEQLAKPLRETMIQQTMSGRFLSIRQGNWKYLSHQGSGGNNYQREGRWGMSKYALPEKDPNAPGQLYDLSKDPGETNNLYSAQPEIVQQLEAKLKQFVESGRSVPERNR